MQLGKRRDSQFEHDPAEIKQALAKADEYERLSTAAKSKTERIHYEKMHRKWLGIAEGWRFINDIARRY